MNLRAVLEKRLSKALAKAGFDQAPALVRPSARPQFGHYQANGCMAAAKRAGADPRELAERVIAAAELDDLVEKLEVAGPGFINITLKTGWLAGQLTARLDDARLGVDAPTEPQTVVVDYSSPNLAKEMHVGHLRSTIIGDALARVLKFIGHNVIRQNHVGDWGTQFGMVILGMWHICMAEERDDQEYINREFERLGSVPRTADITERRGALEEIIRIHQQGLDGDWDGEKFFHPFLRKVIEERSLSLDDLLDAYRFVNLVETLAKDTGLLVRSPPDGKPKRLESLSSYVTARFLQKKGKSNEQEQEAWQYACGLTLKACDDIYSRLNITLAPEDVRGESDYAPDLPKVVEDLRAAGVLEESQGAQCVFLDEFRGKGPDDSDLPVIVQKSDGAYLYATTDLAAMRFRTGKGKADGVVDWAADRILYVTDSRQGMHFAQVFGVARKAGFVSEDVSLEHVPFGMMLGENRQPFKARTGDTVKLIDLLAEAEAQAGQIVRDKNPDLDEAQTQTVARAVGIGAVKYADLSQNRTSDYVFSWAKMLSLEGNTAPYMQYAYARVCSIFRRAGVRARDVAGDVVLTEPAERALGVTLVQFPETVETVAADCLPNVLCAYLYDLAGAFMSFYEACPVLKAPDEATRASRLVLCRLTAMTIETGLDLLGIETIEQM